MRQRRKLYALDKNVYIGSCVQAATGSQFAHCQLFNPADSGVLVELMDVRMYSSSARIASFHWTQTELTGGVESTKVRQKVLDQPTAPQANLWEDTNVAQQGTDLLSAYFNVGNGHLRNGESGEPLLRGIIIPEGYGVMVVGDTINQALTIGYEWREH